MSNGLLITRDLFFTSKVTGTAGALGFAMDVAPDAAAGVARCATTVYKAVFIDLACVDDAAPLCRLEGGPPVVAFGSHVDTTRLAAAREAGCTEVLPRSKFSATLPDLLRKYLA